MAWAALIRAVGPAIARMAAGAETRAAAGAATRGAAALSSGVKPKGSPWPGMMHAFNQDTASRAKKIEDEKANAATKANESLKDLAKSMLVAGPAAFGLSAAFKKTVQHVADFNRQFAQYNGKSAASFAQLDVNRVRRDINFGAATSDSSTALNSSLNKLEEAFQPVEVALTELLNSGLVILIDLVKPAVDGMAAVVKAIDTAVDTARDWGITKQDLITDEAWARMDAAKRMQGTAGGLGVFLGGVGGMRGGGPAEVAAAQFRAVQQQGGYRRQNEFRDRVNKMINPPNLSGAGTQRFQVQGPTQIRPGKAMPSKPAGRGNGFNPGLKPGDAPPLG